MGSAYFVVTASDVDGYDPTAIEGKMLSRADQKLEKAGVHAQLGVAPLHTFCGDDMSEFLDDFGIDDVDPESLGEKWFDPAPGLATVEAMIAAIEADPAAVEDADIVLDDLRTFRTVLTACAARGVQWHLSIDI
jgi:hypothetical protein